MAEDQLGERILSLREKRGWTQKELAERAGISVTFLSELENGKRAPSSGVLLRLANALGTSLDFLMTGRTTMTTDHPITIPSELNAAAEEHGWSHGDTVGLLRAFDMLIARRTRTGEPATGRTLSKQDWITLHTTLFSDA